jgi:hypothetical protein
LLKPSASLCGGREKIDHEEKASFITFRLRHCHFFMQGLLKCVAVSDSSDL